MILASLLSPQSRRHATATAGRQWPGHFGTNVAAAGHHLDPTSGSRFTHVGGVLEADRALWSASSVTVLPTHRNTAVAGLCGVVPSSRLVVLGSEGVEKIACNPAVTFGSSLRGPQMIEFGPVGAREPGNRRLRTNR